MSHTLDEPASPLQIAHASIFSFGLVSTLIGTFVAHAVWFVLGGACLAVSGALILVGCRLTFRGPLGVALRAALGSSAVRRLNLRAVIWICLGILLSVWGFQRMRRERYAEPLLQEPMAIRAFGSPAN